MLTGAQNETLTRTGPGTPMGDVFRRYWQPVALSDEVTSGGKPRQLKIMSEDLVLFRDVQSQPGLLGLHCSHRAVSLAYGRVEDGGIRCPFHGWLYDVSGSCLEQPAEPADSSFKEKIRHTAYPCRELGGLIFAYMGPSDKQPPLPPFEILVRADGSRMADYYRINSNYLQNLEGALDPIHATYLHADEWSKVKHQLFEMPKGNTMLEETDYGIWRRSLHRRPYREQVAASYGHYVVPGGFMGIRGTVLVQKFQSWYVPTDDEHCIRFMVAFTPISVSDGGPWDYGISNEDFEAPGPGNDYFRSYEEVDTISGIPSRTKGSKGGVKGLLAQDSMANESQGPIADRTQEHLGVGDRVLTMTRRLLQQAVDDVRNGRDPKFLRPEPDDEGLVRVCGNDEVEWL